MPPSINSKADPLIAALQSHQNEICALQSQLDKIKNVSGNLRVDKCKNSFQYYIIKEIGDTKGTYLPKRDIRKAKAIAQQDYNKNVSIILKKQNAAISKFLTAYHPDELDSAYTKLHPGRRSLVSPIRETDSDFAERWQHLPYTSKAFEINAPEYYASNGTRVRSKSEMIIADALLRENIPFRYEFPTSLKGWGIIYPDFTCLNLRSRHEIIWEHFGLMGDPDYTEIALQKISRFAANGYILGKNFIATFESTSTPLSIKQVQNYIKAFF